MHVFHLPSVLRFCLILAVDCFPNFLPSSAVWFRFCQVLFGGVCQFHIIFLHFFLSCFLRSPFILPRLTYLIFRILIEVFLFPFLVRNACLPFFGLLTCFLSGVSANLWREDCKFCVKARATTFHRHSIHGFLTSIDFPNPHPRPRPSLFFASTAALASRRRWTTKSWPLPADRCSAVWPRSCGV